jgi:2-keto-3-deoxy-L-rhamnonate aldolase RhmA
MRTNRVKDRMASGRPSIGSVVTIPDPVSVEVMAAAGTDFLIFDCEHSPISISQLQVVLIAASKSDATLLVRVPSLDSTSIKQTLDIGAEGIIVPNVETEEQCARAVDAVRYAPTGHRGFGPRRASRLHGDRPDYLRRANDEIIALPMIESYTAVENIDAILSVPGLDGIVFGPFDLAVSMGHLYEPGHPDVDAALIKVVDACAKHGVPYGIFSSTQPVAQKWLQRGAMLVTVGSDLQYIDQGVAATRASMRHLASSQAAPAAAAV